MASELLAHLNHGQIAGLPNENTVVKNYFETLFKFLTEYSWIYNVKITELFIEETLDLMPEEAS